ncbi:DUF1015 domain-containing protein [Methanosarcina sp. KYL-1]|uniref:DUF1015 domain-containing protein n=1 Tax=Methanosarcina sp. KYL-1 TaxID=2602068 RepID=UPI0021011C0A|nr:DUF1015 domain-containing protein [Methanosarcina sp. KYL-1]MCQ1535756.1 DUF1015 domain-containing protein [Methanosarcina sp. KYL-1]
MTLHVPRILLPKDNWEKWAVIACDQHTQDREYWKRVEEFVGNTPSTLRLIYPEIYLPLDENRVNNIHKCMGDYKNVLVDHGPCFILVKRSVSGRERSGLVVAVDLEDYEFDGSDSFIRPTEKTIKARLPARVKIREAAEIELSHVLVLYDDSDFSVLPEITADPVYDFDLMEDGGHITGYKISDEKTIKEISDKIRALGFLLVGDGNHSLAAAKSFWEQIKGTVPDDHPARYAMVELVNIHDPGLIFEPIHRVVKGVEPEELLKRFDARVAESQAGHSIGFITKDRSGALIFDRPRYDLEVETLDEIIDEYSVEYEHDPEIVKKLGKEPGNIGFFLPALKKSEFFSLIEKKGVLPKKSFSLGEEKEKRYYIEARKIIQ